MKRKSVSYLNSLREDLKTYQTELDHEYSTLDSDYLSLSQMTDDDLRRMTRAEILDKFKEVRKQINTYRTAITFVENAFLKYNEFFPV